MNNSSSPLLKISNTNSNFSSLYSDFISCNTENVNNLYAKNAIVSNLNTGGGSLVISDTTQSTSSDTGALIISGGLGVGKDMYIGGRLYDLNSSKLPFTSSFDVCGDTIVTIDVPNSWCSKLATLLGKTIRTNSSPTGNSGISDATRSVLARAGSANSVAILTGYNNVRDASVLDEPLNRFQDSYMYLYIINSLLSSNLTNMRDGKVTTTGTWTNMSYATGWGIQTTTNASSVTWTIPSTRYIFVATLGDTASTMADNLVLIDSVTRSTLYTYPFNSNSTLPNYTTKPFISVYDCGTVNTHTIRISSNDTNTLSILWMGCWKPGDLVNNVVMGGCFNRAWLPDATALNNGSFLRMDTINTGCKNACTSLQNIGMTNVRYVDISLNPLANFMASDGVTPSPLKGGGQEWIARQFASVCS